MLIPEFVKSCFPAGEGRVGLYLVVDLYDLVAKGATGLQQLVRETLHDGSVLGYVDEDAQAMTFVARMANLHFADIIRVVARQHGVERGAGGLDARHLHRQVLQTVEVGTPVGEQRDLLGSNMCYVDDDINATVDLENHFYVVLSYTERHIVRLVVKRRPGCGR